MTRGKRLEGSEEKRRSQTGHAPLEWDPKSVDSLGATECWWEQRLRELEPFYQDQPGTS